MIESRSSPRGLTVSIELHPVPEENSFDPIRRIRPRSSPFAADGLRVLDP